MGQERRIGCPRSASPSRGNHSNVEPDELIRSSGFLYCWPSPVPGNLRAPRFSLLISHLPDAGSSHSACAGLIGAVSGLTVGMCIHGVNPLRTAARPPIHQVTGTADRQTDIGGGGSTIGGASTGGARTLPPGDPGA